MSVIEATNQIETVENATPMSKPPMPEPSTKFSESELAHLWNDSEVSNESLHKIVDGHVTSFAFCPSDILQSLNRWAVDNVTYEKRWCGKAELAELLGIVPVVPKQVPVLGPDGAPLVDENGDPVTTVEPTPFLFSVKTGSKRGEVTQYETTKNSTNRPLNEINAKEIKRIALSLSIVFNGEDFIFDSVGNAISAQHRAVAYFMAFCENPELPKIPIGIKLNVPAIFADTADTGRSRSDADTITRHEDILREETLVDREGNALGADAKEQRGKMGKELSSVLRLVNMRLCGKNVNASKKADKRGLYLRRHFDDTIDQLINMVYFQTTQSAGEKKDKIGLGHTLGRANLAAAIVLAELSGKESPAIPEGRSLTIPEPTKPIFTIDVEAWLDRIKAANDELNHADGETYAVLKQIHQANRNGRQTTQDKFASICYLVATMADMELQDFKPQGTTNYAIPAKDSVTADKYPVFGGADRGKYTPPKAGE